MGSLSACFLDMVYVMAARVILCGSFLTLCTYAETAGCHLRDMVLMEGNLKHWVIKHKVDMGFGLDEKECDT